MLTAEAGARDGVALLTSRDLREAGVASALSGLPASGTGTDCIAIAAPDAGDRERYAGKHTVIGHLIGQTVHAAVCDGAEQWKRERAEGTR